MMAEKSNRATNMLGKPGPMKLFGAWEVDRTPVNCIPRLCSLNVTRLVVLKPIVGDINSVHIAVRMQNSKRHLRSNEIMISSSGLIDTEVDLTFSLQYPHFLKRNNNLEVILQRRKRYKNRTMFGYKTLAHGTINMSEVLQKPIDSDLDLYSSKDKNVIIAKVSSCAISSQPVDHEDRLKAQGPAVEAETDDDDDYTSNEEGCDSEPAVEDSGLHTTTTSRSHALHMRKALMPKMYTHHVDRPDPSERNIKQKFIALLKKFRIPEAEVSDPEQYQEELEQELISHHSHDFEDLMDELDSLSDSGPDVDDISISSTPKPSLRPFFSSTTLSVVDKVSVPSSSNETFRKGDENHESGTDPENTDTSQAASSPPKSLNADDRKPVEKEKKNRLFVKDKSILSSKEKRSVNIKEKSISKDSECSPQKTVLEQLARIFPLDDSIPDHILLVNAVDGVGECLANQLLDRAKNVLNVLSHI